MLKLVCVSFFPSRVETEIDVYLLGGLVHYPDSGGKSWSPLNKLPVLRGLLGKSVDHFLWS